MDSRRTTRAAPVDENASRRATRNSPARRSPPRKSPSRKSPSRVRGESKTISPKQQQSRAPSIQSNATEDGSKSSRGRPRKTTAVAAASSIPEDEPPTVSSKRKSNLSPKISLPTLSEENIRKLTTSTSAVTSKSTVTTTASRVQVTGDRDDLSEITSRYRQEATAALDRMEFQRSRFTPTPSEASRRSVQPSRSVSRSLIGESDNEEENEGEDEDRASNRYESFAAEDRYRYVTHDVAPSQLREFGGAYGAFFLMVFAAVGGFYLQSACSKGGCQLYIPNGWPTLEDIHMHFHQYIAYLYLGLASWTFSLYWIPIGRRCRARHEGKQINFTFNGILVSLSVLVCIYIVTFMYDFPIMNLMYLHYTKFVSVAIAFAFILSFWGYRRSLLYDPSTWNPYARSGNVIVDFYAGRQINPFWSEHVDVKLTHYRFNVVVALLINTMFFCRNFEFGPLSSESWETLTVPEILAYFYVNNKYDLTTLVVSSLMLVYVIDLLVHEHHLVSSVELMQEGMGAHALLRYALYPVELSMMTKYVFEHQVLGMPSWAYWVMSVLFLVGMVIKRRSNGIKYDFRMFPQQERFRDIKTILTSQGRRLILSGYWGVVKHPNYLGDIISKLAICIPLCWHFAWPPLLVAIWTIVIIVHRIGRSNKRNQNRYGSAWTQYCNEVPYELIPRVY